MTSSASTSPPRPEGLRVTFRRMRFDFEDGFDRYWHGGSAFRSLFWTQMSTAFQPGETFFVDTARALADHVDDPALLAELDAFCRQEGHHTAQHMKFDRINEGMGIDIAGCRRRFRFMLEVGRRFGPVHQLGYTCALEHFTSGFADLLFRRPDIAEGADPRVQALWSWHAIEEAEHRATCFDVYEAAGGGYATRIRTLLGAWASFVIVSLINTFVLLYHDRRLFTWDTMRGLAYLFGPRGVLSAMIPTFMEYLHPRFHPWTGHTTIEPSMIQRWQAGAAPYIVQMDAPAAPAAI